MTNLKETRRKEWEELRAIEPPGALDGAVDRARRRARRRRRAAIEAGAASLAGLAAAFVILVNTSVPFALACGQMPLLRSLVSAAAADPSLKAALEHDYYQVIDQTYTDNGVSLHLYCVVADGQRLSLLCTLSEGEAVLHGITGPDGKSVGWVGSSFRAEGGKLQYASVSFVEEDLPEDMTFLYHIFEDRREKSEETSAPPLPVGSTPPDTKELPIARIPFHITLDPRFQITRKVVKLNKIFELDGQTLTLDQFILAPTSAQLDLLDRPDNTAWLTHLDFYLEDEHGTRYDRTVNSLTAFGGEDGSPFYPHYRVESAYFSRAEHLTLHITDAWWLDKGKERVQFHLAEGTVEGLPDYVTRWWTETEGDTLILHCESNQETGLSFLSTVPDSGVECTGGGYTMADEDRPEHSYFFVTGVEGDELEMELRFTRRQTCDMRIELF